MSNDNLPAMHSKFARGLSELIALAMDGGMTTEEIAAVLEREVPKLRQPYQNAVENEERTDG